MSKASWEVKGGILLGAGYESVFGEFCVLEGVLSQGQEDPNQESEGPGGQGTHGAWESCLTSAGDQGRD